MSLATPLRTALLATLMAGALAGCLPKNKDWTHPRMADPRKEDKLFATDSAFCEEKIGPAASGAEREAALADCLTRLGWKRKE